jgi:ribonuclease-3 family protein
VSSQEEECSDWLNANPVLGETKISLNSTWAIADRSTQIQRISPASLAYLGDAVYELYIRSFYLLPPKRSHAYHDMVVAQVRAESQAKALRSLEPHLTNTELEILRRGRNAAAGRPKRLDPEIYQQASSLETLMGYLYLTDPQRLNQLLSYLELNPLPQVKDS